MSARLFKISVAWITALCLSVQSVGAAAGGFVCIGCPNTTTGVALSSAPCDEVDACCSNEQAPITDSCPESCPDHDQHSAPADCGCVDISISASTATVATQPVKIMLSLTSFADPIPAMVAWEDEMEISSRMSWTVRGGPPVVRSLAPSSRRTILLI